MALGRNFAIVLLALIGYQVYSFATKLGIGKSVTQVQHEQCHHVTNGNGQPLGMEDVVLTKGGIVLATNDNRTWFHDVPNILPQMTPNQQSQLWYYDLRKPLAERKITAVKITGLPEQEVQRHYHGMALRELSSGDQLYVITHTLLGEAIYIFDVVYSKTDKAIPSEFRLDAIIRDPFEDSTPNGSSKQKDGKKTWLALNNLVAMPQSTKDHHVMYVTNWLGSGQGNMYTQIELLGGMAWSYVLKVEATRGSKTSTAQDAVYDWHVRSEKVITGLVGVNGVDLSKDHRDLILMESIGKGIQIYRIDESTGNVQQTPIYKRSVSLHPDNVWVDPETGDAFTAGNPLTMGYLKHSKDWSQSTASEVVRLPWNNGNYGEPETVILSNGKDGDGKHLSSLSGVVCHKGECVTGAVFLEGLMVCQNIQIPSPVVSK